MKRNSIAKPIKKGRFYVFLNSEAMIDPEKHVIITEAGKQMAEKVEKLFDPIELDPIEIKNRIAVSPMHVSLQDPREYVSDDTICCSGRTSPSLLAQMRVE